MTKARTATIISAVSVLAVGGLTWQFVLSPRMAEADSINTQAMDVETQNVMLTGRYNEAVTRAQPAPEVAAEAQALFAQMPQSAELPAVLDQIMNAATDAGIAETDVASLSTGIPQLVPESEGGVSGVQLATMSISVSAEGSATSTLDFLDNLQSLDRALLVNQASRTPNTDTEVSADGEETNEGDESEESSTDESADDGETPISKKDLLAALPDENLSTAGMMFVLESRLPDLGATVDEMLADLEADWALIESIIREEQPDRLFGCSQAVDLGRSGVGRSRPADVSKGWKLLADLSDDYPT